MCEHGCRASHNERHDGPNIRPRQLRSREAPWEGSYRSKLMSRRTEVRSNEPGKPGGPHNSGRAELGRQNTTIGGLVPGAMKPIGRALGSDHRGRERVTALSVRSARNRRTRTRMYGGVGGGGSNPPADPIRPYFHGFPGGGGLVLRNSSTRVYR